jgi:hypothetical protein
MQTQKERLTDLLQRMSSIQQMERGKVCRMTGRKHYNHQCWHEGRNVVRYVPREHVTALQEAIEGYHLFMELARQYADIIIKRTRQEIFHAEKAKKTKKKGSLKKTKDV